MKVNSTNTIKHQTNSNFLKKVGKFVVGVGVTALTAGGVKAGTLPKPETLFAPPSALVQKTTEPLDGI